MLSWPVPWNAVFALGAALLWGGGDFTGGMGVRKAGGSAAGALRVVLLSHTLSLCALVIVARIRGDVFPQGATLAWGIAGGVVGGLSIFLFYLALSRGAMGASAAVSGLLAAAIPAAVSASIDGRPAANHLIGFVTAGLAIWLIASGKEEQNSYKTKIILAIVSGAGFGIYFVCLKFAAAAAGLVWPMATARIGSLTLCLTILLGCSLYPRNNRTLIDRQTILWASGSACMDTGGNMLFMAATRTGRLDVASVLASLYPASTILLAAWMLKESPTRRQAWGMAVALAAVILIAT